MSTFPFPHPEAPYVPGAGTAGQARLKLLQVIAGPGTARAMRSAGLGRGARAVDVGCGTGTVTRQIADIVGSIGHVTGLDASPEQIEIARRDAPGFEQVRFVVASAYDTKLAHGSFDFAYCRFVLCHLERPALALLEMFNLLRPGGRMLCEEQEASTLTSVPATEAYANCACRELDFARRRGVDADIGMHLPHMMRELGLVDVEVSIWQPAFFRGDEKRFHEFTIAESIPQLVASGLTTPAELEPRLRAIRAVNDDESVLVVLPRIWQVLGRRH
ncbi:MAG: methyltransferase domain-containing protein [Betaproteobacteria bacterium]